jgi:hypothetical protein
MSVERSGYFITFSALVDENYWLALTDYANERNITPDHAVEQLIERATGGVF